MAKGEINLLCSEIDTLLTDICKFLYQGIRDGTILESGKVFADTLIKRSKTQLNAIAKVTATLDLLDPINESYVDMQGPKVVISPSDPQEVYSDVSFEAVSNCSIPEDVTKHYDICPYVNLKATEIKEGKSGYLHRKERFLFFDQQRKVFAAIQESWLLIYINEHALKPSQTLDLAEYNAKANITSKEAKKKEEGFSLHSVNDLKTFYFTAQTPKDMIQWVTAINLQSELSQAKRTLPPIPITPVTTENTDGFESESSNDYEPLTEYQLKHTQITPAQQQFSQSALAKKPLPLPPRNTPVPSHTIQKAESEESMGDYDCVGPAPEDSFSEEDEDDAVYDNPTELKQKSNATYNMPPIQTDDDDEIYDYLQNPSQASVNSQLTQNNSTTITIKEPTKEKENYKPTLKPKLLSFSNKRKQ